MPSIFALRVRLGLKLLLLGLRVMPNDWARELMRQRINGMILEVMGVSRARKTEIDASIEQLKSEDA